MRRKRQWARRCKTVVAWRRGEGKWDHFSAGDGDETTVYPGFCDGRAFVVHILLAVAFFDWRRWA